MINLEVPKSFDQNNLHKLVITVFGVGGAGSNAVDNMVSSVEGIKCVVANTDLQAMQHSKAQHKIQLGVVATKGLGAGSDRIVGAMAAEESKEEIIAQLEGSNMVFITAGMGGGTGTGAAPVVAKIAKELGILTVAVVTKPLHFEGDHRMKTAESGIAELQKFVDTLIIIPNQNLFRIANEKTTFTEAFRTADEVLKQGVQSITDLMMMPGLVNLDFADIETIMSKMGKAMMGTGEATGEDRAVIAAEMAMQNPLLDQSSVKGAAGVLINITGGEDITLFEVDTAANIIREAVDNQNANIIFGSAFNQNMNGMLRVSVVATGIDAESIMQQNSINNAQQQQNQSKATQTLTQKSQNNFSSNVNNAISKTNNNQINQKTLTGQQHLAQGNQQSPQYSKNVDVSSSATMSRDNRVDTNESSILEDQVANFDDYNLLTKDNDNKEMDNHHNNFSSYVSSAVLNAPQKKSLFSRMWENFRWFDDESKEPTQFNRQIRDSNSRGDNARDNYSIAATEEKIKITTTANNSSSEEVDDEIYDIPAFLRRNNK